MSDAITVVREALAGMPPEPEPAGRWEGDSDGSHAVVFLERPAQPIAVRVRCCLVLMLETGGEVRCRLVAEGYGRDRRRAEAAMSAQLACLLGLASVPGKRRSA